VIHETLKSFVNCHVATKVVAEVEWPLYRFLIAISINSTADGFREPHNVPHVVKKLVYCIRANIFEQARLISEPDEEHIDDDSLNEQLTLDYDGGLFGLKKYIIDKGQTPFNAIRHISNLASNAASNDPIEGNVSWNINPAEPERYDVLSIHNKSFRFSSLIQFVDELLTKTDRLLFLEILSDVKLPDTDFTTYEPVESFKNRNYRASAFTEPANVYVNHKQDVIKAWLGNRRKRATMVLNVTNDRIKWKRSAVMSWLDKCLVYLQLLFLLLQLTWGGPARISEMAVLRITNGQDERRNMYFDGTWIMFLFRYNKTRANLGRDRLIPRYPPPIVVKQLIYYFMLVRPAVSYFMKHFDLPGKDQIDEYMFVDHKVGRWSDSMMYRRFDQVTIQHGIGMITTSVYRQAAQLIMDKLVKFKWQPQDDNHISDESFGHSSRQAIESYAIEIGIGELVQKHDKAHFKLGAFKWHAIMIPNSSRRGPLPKRGIDDVDSLSNNGESSQQPATSRPRISNSALITVLPPLQPDISELTARSYLSSIKPILNPDVEMKPRTLVALRTLLNSSTATFKSLYQAKAVQLFLNRETDLLIILPTGGGKSLAFEIAPILEPEGTTVLILPFIALMDEMKQRLKRVMPKFRAEQWHKDRSTDDSLPHILLVSIEEAVSMEFQSFIQLANGNNELRRWVVDEFHVLITQSDFRPIFPRLVNTIRLIPVPFVGLSATIPDSYIDRIRLMISSVSTTVVRSPTDRPNLRYRTYRLKYDTEQELDKELCRQIKEAWNGIIEDEMEDETRFIVFTHSAEAAKHFSDLVNKKSEELGITAVVYHSKMDRGAKEGAYQKWVKGKAKLLVGTGAIGAGMDYSYVRRTWHRGFASSNINFIQEMGRAGRDGEPAACVLVYSSVIEEACKKFISLQDVTEHKSYVEEQGCLRAYLTKFIDGARIDCMSSPGAQMCMPCTLVMKDATLASGVVTTRRNGTMYQAELNQLAFQDMMLSRSDLGEKVHMLLDAVEKACGVCFFRRKTGKNRTDQPMDHTLGKCTSMGGICMRCFGRGHGAARCPEFRESLRFKPGCCWTCGFPQFLFGKLVHGDNTVGQCDKPGLQDKLAGIAWSCWRDTLWQERVKKGFPELLRVSDREFMEWLGQLGKEDVGNAVWLGLFFFQKSEEELDSLDSINLNSLLYHAVPFTYCDSSIYYVEISLNRVTYHRTHLWIRLRAKAYSGKGFP
jgi:superfamily II DNA helicase RecQ